MRCVCTKMTKISRDNLALPCSLVYKGCPLFLPPFHLFFKPSRKMVTKYFSLVLVCLMAFGFVLSDVPVSSGRNVKRDLKGSESASPVLGNYGSSWISGNGGYRPPFYPYYPSYPSYPNYPGGYHPGSGGYNPYPNYWGNFPNPGSSSGGFFGGYGVFPGGYGNGYGSNGGYGGYGGFGGYGGYGGYGNGWGTSGYGTGYGTSGSGGYFPSLNRNYQGVGYNNRSGYATTKK